MKPKVSIITPTKSREKFLTLAHQCFDMQTYENREWLIFDDSPVKNSYFNDLTTDNIKYFHTPQKVSVGEKRNFLIGKSSGDIIVHFDDDDYYARDYVRNSVERLLQDEADLLNHRGFFVYHAITNMFGYWDLELTEGVHYVLSPQGVRYEKLDAQNNQSLIQARFHMGYGFAWTYKKSVWEKIKFNDIDFDEDGKFAVAAEHYFNLTGMHDTAGDCLHFLHHGNASICAPQYIMPLFLMEKVFDKTMVNTYIESGRATMAMRNRQGQILKV